MRVIQQHLSDASGLCPPCVRLLLDSNGGACSTGLLPSADHPGSRGSLGSKTPPEIPALVLSAIREVYHPALSLLGDHFPHTNYTTNAPSEQQPNSFAPNDNMQAKIDTRIYSSAVEEWADDAAVPKKFGLMEQ